MGQIETIIVGPIFVNAIYYKKYMRKYLAKTNNIFGIKIHQDVENQNH